MKKKIGGILNIIKSLEVLLKDRNHLIKGCEKN